jgi:cytochrome c oxidase cbb3-type subunit 3
MPDPQDLLTSHNYDGIQEYDNPTPGWWTWLFILSIVFGLLYCLVFIFAEDVFGVEAFHERAVAANLAKQYGELEGMVPDEPTLAMFVTDPEQQKWLGAGQAVYNANCIACHGSGGVGLSGPNLTDDFYIHVRQPTDIVRVIAQGAANGAMPAWENRLNEPEVLVVSAYVASLRGQDLPGRPVEANAREAPPFFTEGE